MTFIQRFLTSVLPKSWAEDMQTESLSWMKRCSCGFECSVWERGGIRWKAKGSPQRWSLCPRCRHRTRHRIYRKSEN